MLRRVFGFQSTQFVMAAVLMGLVGFQLLYIDSYILTASASESVSEYLRQDVVDVAELTTTSDDSSTEQDISVHEHSTVISDVPMSELAIQKVRLKLPEWLMYVAFSTAGLFLFLGLQSAKRE
ncbi:MAG: hypothetical protein MK006_07210 [Pirellulales bacterium]|nr:hypothetical protein [Pirellulales bacterium]|tara:strand:- start:675 stop:1043 length:369 start_codon:yes stop_codon:yes gene_type:complete